MIRALYTAASGMNAQQANIDNVAHNLANVNTSGFKKSHVQFEDLVYQETTQPPARPPRPSGEAPIGLEIGLGTRAVATVARLQRRQPARHQLAARHRDRRRRLPPDHAARRHDRLHARRCVATRRAGHARHLGRVSRSSRRSRFRPTPPRSRFPRTASCRRRSPARAPRSSSARIELATFQNPAGLQAARRQPLHRDDGLRRAADRRARDRRPRHHRAGLPRRLERERRRGNGQHDPRPARLRGQLQGHQGRRRNARRTSTTWFADVVSRVVRSAIWVPPSRCPPPPSADDHGARGHCRRRACSAWAPTSMSSWTTCVVQVAPALSRSAKPSRNRRRAWKATIRFILRWARTERSGARAIRAGAAVARVHVTSAHAHAATLLCVAPNSGTADVVSTRHEIEAGPLRPLPTAADAVGSKALRDLAPDACILRNAIASRPDVRTGQEVLAISNITGVVASAQMVAAEQRRRRVGDSRCQPAKPPRRQGTHRVARTRGDPQ